MPEILHLEPIFHEKIWGGRRLESDFAYSIPDGPIGECWAISAHPNGDCKVLDEKYKGYTLSKLFSEHKELFGNTDEVEFPLLIKILDAADDLSIQVHPDDAYAKEHENSLGKRECWYVLYAKEGASIIVGQKAKDAKEFKSLVDAGKWDELLNEIPVHTGDFFQIEPGTVHAIKGNTMVLETQQSSDVTYRVYDYDRKQADGTLRPLHLAKSLDVIDFEAKVQQSGKITNPEIDGYTLLVETPNYKVERLRTHERSLTYHFDANFLCVSVVEGSGTFAGQSVKKGDHLLITAGVADFDVEGTLELIVSHTV